MIYDYMIYIYVCVCVQPMFHGTFQGKSQDSARASAPAVRY